MSALVVQHVVTQAELTRILLFFKRPTHAKHGYYFEVDEMGATMRDAVLMEGLSIYSDNPSTATKFSSWWKQPAFLLKVYRDTKRDLAPAVEPTAPAAPDVEKLTSDELRVLKKFAQYLLDTERAGRVVLG